MLSFLTDPANLPFAAALAVMVLIVLIETAAVLLGAGFSGLLDGLAPDLNMDADVSVAAPSAFAQVLSWLRVGEVPLLMLLLLALTVFGLSGLLIQLAVRANTGSLLPPLLAAIPACFISLSLVRVLGGLLGKYMPKDETAAVSAQSLLGRNAVILAGTAKAGSPAQAKVHDQHGLAHYLLAEPEQEGDIFAAGEQVVLVSQQGAVFKAARLLAASHH